MKSNDLDIITSKVTQLSDGIYIWSIDVDMEKIYKTKSHSAFENMKIMQYRTLTAKNLQNAFLGISIHYLFRVTDSVDIVHITVNELSLDLMKHLLCFIKRC